MALDKKCAVWLKWRRDGAETMYTSSLQYDLQ